MDKISRIFDTSPTDPIYFIVPGFIGNYTEGFVKDLYNFLLTTNFSFHGVVFPSHDQDAPSDTKLTSPDEMIKLVSSEYSLLRQKFPQRPIIILAHSQGCAISLRAAKNFDENTSFILFAPAIYLDQIILPRVTPENTKIIESRKPVCCQISGNKSRIIDLEWILSYRKFSLIEHLSMIKQHCFIIRPKDDYISASNVEILCQKLPNFEYMELTGDHTFFQPSSAFQNLIEIVFMKKE